MDIISFFNKNKKNLHYNQGYSLYPTANLITRSIKTTTTPIWNDLHNNHSCKYLSLLFKSEHCDINCPNIVLQERTFLQRHIKRHIKRRVKKRSREV